jgi:HEPN domain-containing protein
MTLNKKQVQARVKYWRESADHDWVTAQGLWKLKRYDACLFYCHLVLEKLLKGLVTQATQATPPYVHDLVTLLERTNIEAEADRVALLVKFTSFNLRCRYPQDKEDFYKMCTREFSEVYFKKTQQLITWLKKYYQKEK